MLVFSKENLVFLAVPKTGTTAIEGALAPRASVVMRDPPELKHATVQRYRRFVRPLLNQIGKFELELMAVVRHPVDWLGSWYRYRSRDGLVGLRSTRNVSFDEFVSEYCKSNPAPFAAVGAQSRFMTDDSGKVGIDHLFQYEQQDKITAFWAERLGPLPAFKRMNASPVREANLSASVLDRLKAKHAEEFALWEGAAR